MPARSNESHVSAKDSLSTLERGIDAIVALNANPLLTAQDLATKLGIARTSARRILDTLVRSGVAEKGHGDSHYRLAPGSADLSSGLSENQILAHVAGPLLNAATVETGWTMSLVTLTGDILILQVTTAHIAPYSITNFRIGNRIPVYASQSGQVVLAYQRALQQDSAACLRTPSLDGPTEAAVIRAQGYYAPIVGDPREAHLYVPVFLGDLVPGCLIMRYLISAVPRQRVIESHVPRLQAIAGQISADAMAIMQDKTPAWTRQWPVADV